LPARNTIINTTSVNAYIAGAALQAAGSQSDVKIIRNLNLNILRKIKNLKDCIDACAACAVAGSYCATECLKENN